MSTPTVRPDLKVRDTSIPRLFHCYNADGKCVLKITLIGEADYVLKEAKKYNPNVVRVENKQKLRQNGAKIYASHPSTKTRWDRVTTQKIHKSMTGA